MPLSDEERNRLEDDILFDRRITRSLYCGSCGYNLKTLPRSYVCPECGQPYNARRQPMKGIYFPHDVEPPIAQIAGALISAVVAVSLLSVAFRPFSAVRVTFGLIFAVATVYLSVQTYWRVKRLIKFQALARRITQQEEEED